MSSSVQAPTPEGVDQAASALGAALAQRKDVIRSVSEPQGGAFFGHNGIVDPPTGEVGRVTGGLTQAAPLLATLAADPSLRGSLDALSDALAGVHAGMLPLDELTRPLKMAAQTARAALAGRPADFSWQVLASGHAAQPDELRRLLQRSSRCSITMRSNPVARRPTQSRKPRANCSSAPNTRQASSRPGWCRSTMPGLPV